MLFTPYPSKCNKCGTAFTMSLQLIVNLNQGVPSFMREGQPPHYDCTNCDARMMITAPLLVLNFSGNPPQLNEPPLIFVPSEGADPQSASSELQYLLGELQQVSGKAWNDGMVDRLVVTDRKTLAGAIS